MKPDRKNFKPLALAGMGLWLALSLAACGDANTPINPTSTPISNASPTAATTTTSGAALGLPPAPAPTMTPAPAPLPTVNASDLPTLPGATLVELSKDEQIDFLLAYNELSDLVKPEPRVFFYRVRAVQNPLAVLGG